MPGGLTQGFAMHIVVVVFVVIVIIIIRLKSRLRPNIRFTLHDNFAVFTRTVPPKVNRFG